MDGTEVVTRALGRTALPAPARVMVQLAVMRAAADAVFSRDRRYDQLDNQRNELRRHLEEIIRVVESAAGRKSVESVPRAVALAKAESARKLLAAGSGEGVVAAVRHLRSLAHEVRLMCDQYDILTGAHPLGAA